MGGPKKKKKSKDKKVAQVKVFKADVFQGLRMKYACLGKAEWWWLFDDSIEKIGKALDGDNFVVLDGFLGKELADGLHKELMRAYLAGKLPETKHEMIGCPRMEPGALGGKVGTGMAYKMNAVRGDHVAWFSGQEKACEWKVLPMYLQRMDTLVSELSSVVPSLSGTASLRSNAMATCYPGGGAHYVRHCDNTSEIKNGRRLTALYYSNPNWKPGDGGELRVFAPQKIGDVKDYKVLCEVPPLSDRVVLFFSDERVPHEVMPATVKRFAVTTWYFDKEEKLKANELQTDENLRKENEEKIQQEIEKFQTKYGEQATVMESKKTDDRQNDKNNDANIGQQEIVQDKKNNDAKIGQEGIFDGQQQEIVQDKTNSDAKIGQEEILDRQDIVQDKANSDGIGIPQKEATKEEESIWELD